MINTIDSAKHPFPCIRSIDPVGRFVTVDHLGLTQPVEEGLMEKLADAQTLIAQGKYKPARQTLLAFINQVNAQTGKGNLTSDMASSLIETAQEIIDSLPPK